MEKELKVIHSIICASIAAVIFIIAITIIADLYLPIKDWLKDIFTHHWIGKSILSLVIFIIFGIISFFLPIKTNEEKISKLLKILFWILIIGTLAIFMFFIYEAVK